MFYFDEIDGRKILKSDFIKNAQAFFTTRDICICDKAEIVAPSIELPQAEMSLENNKKLIANYLKIEVKNLISPIQTHSANIEIAKEKQSNYPDTDGLILTNSTQAIFLNFADCTPIIFYDPELNIGAISHAGWRGTAQEIVPKTVEKMSDLYNCNPQNIIALIGPAICGKCYEVGTDVYEKLQKTVKTPLSKFCLQKGDKYHIDLKEINKIQLLQAGIEKIDVCPYCTCCNNEYFFSYRKENGTTLRHSAVMKIR